MSHKNGGEGESTAASLVWETRHGYGARQQSMYLRKAKHGIDNEYVRLYCTMSCCSLSIVESFFPLLLLPTQQTVAKGTERRRSLRSQSCSLRPVRGNSYAWNFATCGVCPPRTPSPHPASLATCLSQYPCYLCMYYYKYTHMRPRPIQNCVAFRISLFLLLTVRTWCVRACASRPFSRSRLTTTKYGSSSGRARRRARGRWSC